MIEVYWLSLLAISKDLPISALLVHLNLFLSWNKIRLQHVTSNHKKTTRTLIFSLQSAQQCQYVL